MKIGYCFTGSFCTFKKSLEVLRKLVSSGHSVTAVMSENAYSTDTRFGSAEYFRNEIANITGNAIIHTISEAEPIGPKRMFDVLCVVPCTGNTLAKLASGITDTSVTMAVKSHLRNYRPVVIGVSTNDALAGAAKNIGALMNYRNYYFVPFSMDDCINKPRSMVCDFTKVITTLEDACCGKEPVLKIF
ncbi:MAG: dipicolinate synthase subunit B [Eubacterium sp.]|nr:dipicolinate synthase subunit B [Eubacterium sp.]